MFSVRHPESGRGRISSGSSRAGRVGLSVLRLVRKEIHRLAWQVQLDSLRPSGSSLIGAHKRAIARAKQKLGVDEGSEQRITCGPVEAPEPLRLRRCQTQSGHLDVLALDSSQYVIKRLLCWHLWSPCSSLFRYVDALFRATHVPRAAK